jgi:uncharacterized protein YjdB
MDQATVSAGSQTSYTWTPSETDPSVLNPYDFNIDGLTNGQDAQDLLDYLTGNISEEGLDLEAGDADEDGKLTTYDAHLILLYCEDIVVGNYVPAGGYADVTVTFSFSVDDDIYTNGAYIEGFTSLTEKTDTEGVKGVTHSIPILGFYGDWTDPSMFDRMSYNDLLRLSYYGASDVKEPYVYDESGDYHYTNLMVTKQRGSYYMFSGNPYDVEEEFPYDRLAINSSTSIEDFYYTLIRPAATTGLVLSYVDEPQGDVLGVLAAMPTAYDEEAIWYDEEDLTWMNTDPRSVEVGFTPGELGFEEDDVLRIGFYAFPEYTGMMREGVDLTDADAGHLEALDLAELVMTGDTGAGTGIGYDLTVDDTAPEILDVTFDPQFNLLYVRASDNQNIAFLGLLDLTGEVIYDCLIPADPEFGYTFIIDDYIDDVSGYIAVFVGDYAGNETAVAVKVNDKPNYSYTNYWLTDNVRDGRYLIANTYETTDSGMILSNNEGEICSENVHIYNIGSEEKPSSYISGNEVNESSVWTIEGGSREGHYMIRNGDSYLGVLQTEEDGLLLVCDGYFGEWEFEEDKIYASGRGLYVAVDDDGNWFITDQPAKVYFFCEDYEEADMDPTVPWSITLEPGTLDLYVGNETDLIASITPITADQDLIWYSTDEDVVTVDEKGHVTAKGEGTASVLAMAAADKQVFGYCIVNVLCLHETLEAIVFDANSQVHYAEFSTEDVSDWHNLHEEDLATEIYANMMYTPEDLYCVLYVSDGAYLAWVDTETYEPIMVGYNYYPAFDMTQGLLGDPYLDEVYVYGMYLIAGNLAPNYDYGAPISGIPYAMLDTLNETDIGDYIAGVACVEMGPDRSSYYLLDVKGNIWATDLVYDEEEDEAYFTDPVLVMETGISCTYYYQSLYFDGEYLLWSYTGGDISKLFVLDVENGIVYDAGDFGENVWPVPGLYQYGTVAPGYVALPEEEDDGDGSGAAPQPVLTKDDPAMKELQRKVDADLKAAQRKRSGEERASGGLNAVTIGVTKEAENVSAEAAGTQTDDGSVKVELSEDEDSANGFVTVSYDPEKLKLKSAESALDYNSIAVDEENGTVKFAYADAEDIEAGTVLAELSFEEPCEDVTLDVETSERGEDTDLEESSETTLEGEGHEWGEPEVDWSGDHKKATFTFKCGKCGEEETLDAEVTQKEENGKIVYTAVVTGPDGEQYTATYKADVPKTGTVRSTVILAIISAISVIGAILLIILRRKRRGQE